MVSRLMLFVSVVAIGGAAHAAPSRDTLDRAARDYVRLQLAIGQKEDGYVDAYYGPAKLKAEGEKIGKAEDLKQLAARVAKLTDRVRSLQSSQPERTRFLLAQLKAAQTRLRMLQGEKLSFEDEAEGLFGVRPQLKPLSSYDPVLARIEKLVPGEGPLADRVDAFQERFVIATDRLKPVFDAAIAGCKARTAQHIAMPAGERFDLSFVTGKSWSGYNYYQGDFHSRIEVNTDLPVRIARAVDLGCHEGYPGHHALNSLLEEKLTRGRGWIEFSVYPLYSPQSFIAEGTANYGIDLAFPEADKLAFETSTLYPLAGLPTAEAERYDQLLEAMKDLSGARLTIEKEFLDGRISEQQAIELERKYRLSSEARAKQSVAFAKQYRSYVINYGLGEQMVKDDVESHPDAVSRWKRFEQIISGPTLPSDLKAQ